MKISEVKARYSIEEVATRLGLNPVPRGRRVVCTCPFHEDADPSMILTTEGKYAGRYICRPCGGVGSERGEGDLIDLIMRAEGLSKPMEAVDWLTGENRREPIKAPEKRVEREAPVINEDLSAFALQAKVELSDAALAYLESRGLAGIAREFHLGSTDGDHFPIALLPWYWDDKSGAMTRHKNFLNRLIVPYINADGVVTHVNARALDPGRKPKYLKAQTPHKASHTPPYMLDEVLAQGAEDIWITEGEFDALSLYASRDDIFACGIPGVDALLESYLPSFEGRRVWLLMDNDNAGEQARKDLERRLFPYARVIHQVVLPPYVNDVNALLVKEGADFLAGYLEAVMRKAVRRTVRRTF